jgi:hypothetical protein
MDPVPEVSSSIPRIAGTFVLFAFAATVGSTVLMPGLPAAETQTPAVVQAPAYHLRAGRDDLSFLRRNWFDPDAIHLRVETVSSAEELLQQLPVSVERPHLSASAEGEIGFSWTQGIDRFEAMLDAEDHLVWVSKIGGKFLPGGDVSISSAADRDVFYAALREFYGRA